VIVIIRRRSISLAWEGIPSDGTDNALMGTNCNGFWGVEVRFCCMSRFGLRRTGKGMWRWGRGGEGQGWGRGVCASPVKNRALLGGRGAGGRCGLVLERDYILFVIGSVWDMS